MRAIDADKFECVTLQDCTDEFAEGAEYILEKIDEAPTLDVEPIRYGCWIDITPVMSSGKAFKCSKCGRTVVLGMSRSNLDVVEEYPYCHCGAKMRKEDE